MKPNLTIDYLRKAKPTSRRIISGPTVPPPPGRRSVGRLQWSIQEGRLTYHRLARQIRDNALPSAAFFLDTAFLTGHEIPKALWDALRTRRVVITPTVLYELQDWIATPFYNRSFREDVVAAIEGNNSCVGLIDPAYAPFNVRQAATYYIKLLGMRKKYPRMVKDTLTELGNPFSEKDIERICQHDLQDRGCAWQRRLCPTSTNRIF